MFATLSRLSKVRTSQLSMDVLLLCHLSGWTTSYLMWGGAVLCLLDQVSYTQSNFPRLNKSVGCDIIVISKYLCAQLDLRANIMMYRLKGQQWRSFGLAGASNGSAAPLGYVMAR